MLRVSRSSIFLGFVGSVNILRGLVSVLVNYRFVMILIVNFVGFLHGFENLGLGFQMIFRAPLFSRIFGNFIFISSILQKKFYF